MAIIWEEAISFLAWNLNSGLIYLNTAVNDIKTGAVFFELYSWE